MKTPAYTTLGRLSGLDKGQKKLLDNAVQKWHNSGNEKLDLLVVCANESPKGNTARDRTY